jgi:hypothetical protein
LQTRRFFCPQLASGDIEGGGGGLAKENKAALCTQKPTDSKLFGDWVRVLCMLVLTCFRGYEYTAETPYCSSILRQLMDGFAFWRFG